MENQNTFPNVSLNRKSPNGLPMYYYQYADNHKAVFFHIHAKNSFVKMGAAYHSWIYMGNEQMNNYGNALHFISDIKPEYSSWFYDEVRRNYEQVYRNLTTGERINYIKVGLDVGSDLPNFIQFSKYKQDSKGNNIDNYNEIETLEFKLPENFAIPKGIKKSDLTGQFDRVDTLNWRIFKHSTSTSDFALMDNVDVKNEKERVLFNIHKMNYYFGDQAKPYGPNDVEKLSSLNIRQEKDLVVFFVDNVKDKIDNTFNRKIVSLFIYPNNKVEYIIWMGEREDFSAYRPDRKKDKKRGGALNFETSSFF